MTVNNEDSQWVKNQLTFGQRVVYLVNPGFPKLILDELTKQVINTTYDRSLVTGNGEGKMNLDLRASDCGWIYWDTWIAGIMHNIMISANRDFYHYDLVHFDSKIQATRYKTGQHYGWHVDAGNKDESKELVRKLSISLILDSDYEGGELEIFDPTSRQALEFKPKAGNIILFPSWVSHRVKPVTSGTRYSLVAWMNGPAFK